MLSNMIDLTNESNINSESQTSINNVNYNSNNSSTINNLNNNNININSNNNKSTSNTISKSNIPKSTTSLPILTSNRTTNNSNNVNLDINELNILPIKSPYMKSSSPSSTNIDNIQSIELDSSLPEPLPIEPIVKVRKEKAKRTKLSWLEESQELLKWMNDPKKYLKEERQILGITTQKDIIESLIEEETKDVIKTIEKIDKEETNKSNKSILSNIESNIEDEICASSIKTSSRTLSANDERRRTGLRPHENYEFNLLRAKIGYTGNTDADFEYFKNLKLKSNREQSERELNKQSERELNRQSERELNNANNKSKKRKSVEIKEEIYDLSEDSTESQMPSESEYVDSDSGPKAETYVFLKKVKPYLPQPDFIPYRREFYVDENFKVSCHVRTRNNYRTFLTSNVMIYPSKISIHGVKIKKIPILINQNVNNIPPPPPKVVETTITPKKNLRITNKVVSFSSSVSLQYPPIPNGNKPFNPLRAYLSYNNSNNLEMTLQISSLIPPSVATKDVTKSEERYERDYTNHEKLFVLPSLAATSTNISYINCNNGAVNVSMKEPTQSFEFNFVVNKNNNEVNKSVELKCPKINSSAAPVQPVRKSAFRSTSNYTLYSADKNPSKLDNSREMRLSKRKSLLKEREEDFEPMDVEQVESENFGGATFRGQQLATYLDGLEVGPSTIPNAGRGVFATRFFPKNSMVTEFVGQLITREDAQKIKRNGKHLYIRTIDWNTLIDGIKEPVIGMGLGSFCNDGILPQNYNCAYKRIWNGNQCKYELLLQAIRDIEVGQELLVSYGRGYWKDSLVTDLQSGEIDSDKTLCYVEHSDEDESSL